MCYPFNREIISIFFYEYNMHIFYNAYKILNIHIKLLKYYYNINRILELYRQNLKKKNLNCT